MGRARAGRYSDTVAAGETVYGKIRLAKGQVLEVKATVDTSSIQQDVSKPDYKPGLVGLDYDLDIYSPIREQLSDSAYPEASADLEGDSGAGSVTGTARGPRILGYEQILASDFSLDKFPGPGVGYFSLSAADSDSQPAEVPAELPVDLEVSVIGRAQPSSPDFAKSLPGPAPAQEPQAPSAIGGAASTDLGDASVTIGLVALLTFLCGIGLGTVAAVVLGLGGAREATVRQ